MADINLTFGAEDLDKLKGILADIRKEVDALKKTISERGGIVTDNDVKNAKQLAIEEKKIENEIKKQALASQRLDQQQEKFNVKTRESVGIIGKLESEARGFRSAMKAATTEAEMKRAQEGLRKTNAALTKAKGTTASWGKALGSFQFKFNALGNIAANVLSKMTQQMKQVIRESIRMAAEFQGVDAAFKKLKNSDKVLQDLTKATRGAVSEMALMQQAIKADNFRIPMDVLAKGLEFATNRAAQTGESVDYLVNSFVIGLGRNSPKILDNLGISVLELADEVKKTGDFMTAVGNITDRELKKMGTVILTDAQRMDQFKASVENLKIGLGQLALKGFTPFVNLGNRLIDSSGKQSKELDKEKSGLDNLVTAATSANVSSEARLGIIKQIQKIYPGILGNLSAEKISNEELSTAINKVSTSLANRYDLAKNQEAQNELEKEYNKLMQDRDKQLKLIAINSQALNEGGLDSVQVQIYTTALNKANAEYLAIVDNIAVAEIKMSSLTSKADQLSGGFTSAKSGIDGMNDGLDDTNEALTTILPKILKITDAFGASQKFTLLDPIDPEDIPSIDIAKEFIDSFLSIFNDGFKDQQDALTAHVKSIGEAYDSSADEQAIKAKETEEKKKAAFLKTYEVTKNGMNALSNLFEANKQRELSAVGANEEKRLAIEKKYRKKQQAIAIAMTIINTAEGVVKVLKDYGLPWGLIPAAAMAALGAVEISTIKSQTFAKGGPILGEPHSRGGVNVEAEGGEFIINKKSTGKYKNLIEAINQDDRVRIMDAMSRDRKIMISQVDPYTQKMYDLMKSQPVYGEDNEFYYKHKGNMLIKTKKR